MSNEKYDYGYFINEELVKEGADSHCKILQMVSPNSAVLECGPAYGIMTKYLQENLHCAVQIIEYDKDSFEHAVQFASGGICTDIEEDSWLGQFEDGSFDYIICADILEHLRNPQAVLEKMRRFLKPDGSVLLSVPNVAHGDIILNLLGDRFNYTQLGLLDNTHIHLFARENLWAMIRDAGYYIAEEACIRSGLFTTEQGKRLSQEFSEKIKQFFAAYPNKDVYQFIYRLTLHEVETKSELGIIDPGSNTRTFSPIVPIQDLNSRKRYLGKVYFDCGSGLSEKSSIHFYIEEDNRIRHRIDLPEGCCAVRLDPVEGCGCLVWNLQVRCEDQFLKVSDHNGIALNDVYIFRTTDPQMYFESLPAGSKWLEIETEIVGLEQGAWTRLVEAVEEIERNQAELLAKNESKAAEYAGALQKVEEEKSSLSQNYEQMIAANLAEYQAGIADKERELSEIAARKEAVERDLSDLRLELVDAAEQKNVLEQELEEIEGKKSVLERELAHYQEHYHAAINQREELKQQLAQAQYAYNVISNAFFWKITKPFRVILDGIKSLLRRNQFTRLACKGLKCWKENGFSYTWKRVQDRRRHRQDFAKAVRPVFTLEELEQQKRDVFPRNIKFSILVPLYNTPERFLHEMIRSVLDQTYSNWELCMADGSDSQHKDVERICKSYRDSRVRYKKLEKNLGISENTNACIEMATGDYIALLDHDDLLHPAALHEVMRAICEQDADFVYTDEATFESPNVNKIITMHFKPDYAPDNLRANNYICH